MAAAFFHNRYHGQFTADCYFGTAVKQHLSPPLVYVLWKLKNKAG
jgi:hypothetical protein